MELTQAQKDALLAEILGDVGKLHDDVGQLGGEITNLRAGIVGAIEDAKRTINDHAAKQHEAEGLRVAEHYKAILGGLIEEAVGKPVTAAVVALKEQTALAEDASHRLQRQLGDTLSRFWLPVAGLAAAFVLVIGLGSLVFFEFVHPQGFLSQADKSALVTGQRLQAAWPHLDNATRQKINAAVEATETK